MFPTQFADEVVTEHTDHGEIVLDPFAGRGTAVFSAAHQGRQGIGIEVNPVGWVYAQTKLWPAEKESVAARFEALGRESRKNGCDTESLPRFFHHCFSRRILEFLVTARGALDWQNDCTDRTTMALLLVYLHGKRGAALSNQMRQTKSMAPDYAVRWWRERELAPPEFDPATFLVNRLDWRYAKGHPQLEHSQVHLGDSERCLPLIQEALMSRGELVKLLFTSPPYFGLTNYHYDQWLRLWLLGGPPNANRVQGSRDVRGKFENAVKYRALLRNVFTNAAKLMAPSSVVYVRTGLGEVTFDTTVRALQEIFPHHTLQKRFRPYTRPTQTSLFGDCRKKAGEVDLVMFG